MSKIKILSVTGGTVFSDSLCVHTPVTVSGPHHHIKRCCCCCWEVARIFHHLSTTSVREVTSCAIATGNTNFETFHPNCKKLRNPELRASASVSRCNAISFVPQHVQRNLCEMEAAGVCWRQRVVIYWCSSATRCTFNLPASEQHPGKMWSWRESTSFMWVSSLSYLFRKTWSLLHPLPQLSMETSCASIALRDWSHCDSDPETQNLYITIPSGYFKDPPSTWQSVLIKVVPTERAALLFLSLSRWCALTFCV